MIDWERYHHAAQEVYGVALTYDSSLMDLEDVVKESSSDDLKLRVVAIKTAKETLQETIEQLDQELEVIKQLRGISP